MLENNPQLSLSVLETIIIESKTKQFIVEISKIDVFIADKLQKYLETNSNTIRFLYIVNKDLERFSYMIFNLEGKELYKSKGTGENNK